MNPRLAIVGLTTLSFVESVAAQGVVLEWTAPAACPRGAQVERGVERRLGRPLSEVRPDLRVVAEVHEVPAGFELILRTVGEQAQQGERRLLAPTCGELAKAAALIVALAIDPDVDSDEGEAPPAPGPPPGRAAEPRVEPVESAGGQQTRPERATGAPSPDAREPTAGAAPRRSSDQLASRPAGEPPEVFEFHEDRSPPLHLGAHARAGLALDLGSLAAAGFGPTVGFGLSVEALRLELGGLWVPPRTVESELRSRPVGELGLLSADLGLCYGSLAPRVRLSPCLRVEYGRIYGQGGAGLLVAHSDVGAPWALVGAELGVMMPLTERLYASGRLGVGLPLVRTVFTVGAVGKVHQAGDVVGRVGLGLALRLH